MSRVFCSAEIGRRHSAASLGESPLHNYPVSLLVPPRPWWVQGTGLAVAACAAVKVMKKTPVEYKLGQKFISQPAGEHAVCGASTAGSMMSWPHSDVWKQALKAWASAPVYSSGFICSTKYIETVWTSLPNCVLEHFNAPITYISPKWHAVIMTD